MVETGLATHPGRIRSHNEDYAYHGPTPHGYVGIVCDGMGGHQAGEVAARLAAEAVYAFLQEAPPADPENLLREALLAANHHLLLYRQHHPEARNLGSTAVVALLQKGQAFVAHIGDSRAYLARKNDLSLLTQDDSLVQQMLASGLISPEQAFHHPQKNVLTQHLGQETPPTPHVHRVALPARSLLLLCTDGLSNLLSKEEILAILQDRSLSIQQKCDKLVEKANQNGGYDNITALLVQAPAKSATFAAFMPFKLPPLRYLIGGVIVLAVLGLLAWVFARREEAPAPKEGEVIVLNDDSLGTDTTPISSPPLSEGGDIPLPPTEQPAPVPVSPPAEAPARKSTPPVPQETASSLEKARTFEYTVRKGDNLTRIAQAFSVSQAELRRLNALKDKDDLKAGQKLKIPVQAVHTHTVQKGETISSLARKYHTTTEAIRRANGIEEEKIRIGQKLLIPVVKR